VNLVELVSHEIELLELEKWVYSETQLEETLNSNDYLEIISINYKTPSGLYEAEKVLSNYFSMGKYHEWNIRNILQKIVEKPMIFKNILSNVMTNIVMVSVSWIT